MQSAEQGKMITNHTYNNSFVSKIYLKTYDKKKNL